MGLRQRIDIGAAFPPRRFPGRTAGPSTRSTHAPAAILAPGASAEPTLRRAHPHRVAARAEAHRAEPLSKKTDLVEKLIQEVKLRHPIPKKPMEGVNLLEQGAVIVLMRHMTQTQAEASVKALRSTYEDWNEVRVAQSQEIAACLRTSSRKKGVTLLRDRRETAMALKEYLQDVFQQTHHLDLEELREDDQTAGKVSQSLGVLGFPGAAYLTYLANDDQIPVHLPLVRLLDRLGLIPRTTSLKKARASIESLVPKGKELAFVLAFHEILERWDDEHQPIYLTVKALRETPYGEKTAKERESAIARAEAAAKREEERIRKEEERERKKAEAEARKRQRELERKKKAEEKKLAEARAKSAAADKKKSASKKAASKKKAAKKSAKKAAPQASTAKKASTSKKAVSRKPAAKKAASSGATAKKASSRKASTKTTSSKKGTSKKATSRKSSSKKAASKKATSRKPTSKKKSSKKPSTRRR